MCLLTLSLIKLQAKPQKYNFELRHLIKLLTTLKTTTTQFLSLPKQNLYFDTVSGIALCIPGSYISKKSIYNSIISILPLIFLINQMEHRRSKLKWKRQSFIYTNIFPKVQNSTPHTAFNAKKKRSGHPLKTNKLSIQALEKLVTLTKLQGHP